VTIASPVDNTGQLYAAGGTLSVTGSVTGSGVVHINGGLADLAAAGFEENVDFSGTHRRARTGSSKTYTGFITGFPRPEPTRSIWPTIAFVGTPTGVYTGSATSGVLTVTEGANVATIHLIGDYLGQTFALSADGGGTKVVDPSVAKAPKAAAAGSAILTPAAPLACPLRPGGCRFRTLWETGRARQHSTTRRQPYADAGPRGSDGLN